MPAAARLELGHGTRSGTEDLLLRGMVPSRVAGGSSEAAKQGTKLPKRC